MRFFALIALAAIIGCVAGFSREVTDDEEYSQAPFIPSDEDELAKMSDENKQLFADFCIHARDDFKAHMTKQVNAQTAKVFNVLFNTLQEIASEALNAQMEAVKLGVEALKKGDESFGASADVDKDGELSDEEISDKIALKASEVAEAVEASESSSSDSDSDSDSDSGSDSSISIDSSSEGEPESAEAVKEAKRLGPLKRFTNAVFYVLGYVARTAYGEAAMYLNRVKSQVNVETVQQVVDMACNDVTASIKNQLSDSFTKTKTQLERTAMRVNNKQLVETLRMTNIENVGCLTTGRVLQVNKWCNVVTKLAPVLSTMF